MAVGIAVSRSGDLAVALLEYEGRIQVRDHSFDLGLPFTILLSPQGQRSRLIVLLDQIFEMQLSQKAERFGVTPDVFFTQIAVQSVGEYLDDSGLPDFTPSGRAAFTIRGDDVAQSFFTPDNRKPASDEEIIAFIGLKSYWGWRYGQTEIELALSDARRLGTSVGELARVAIAGDGVYWGRTDAYSQAHYPDGEAPLRCSRRSIPRPRPALPAEDTRSAQGAALRGGK